MNLAALRAQFKTLPPRLTGRELQRRLGINYQSALHYSRKFRYRRSDGRTFAQRDKRQLDPALVDWAQSNIAIARSNGVSRERVRALRKQLKIKPVESRGRKPKGLSRELA